MIWPTDILSVESWILIGTLLLLARLYIHRKWQLLAKMNIPHDPPSLRNFGHFGQLFSKNAFSYDNECKQKYGPIWGFYLFTAPNISIHDPDILRQIFIKEFPNFPIRQARLQKLNGKEMNNALTAIQGEQWKRVRSAMTPTFSTSKLKEMVSIIAWCADNTVEVFNRKIKTSNGRFNAKEVFSRLSLDIVCSAAFSTKVHSQDDTKQEPEISKHAKKLFGGSIFSPIFVLCLLSATFEKLVEKLNMTIFSKETVQYFKNLTNHVIRNRNDSPHTQKRVDLMQLMLDSEVTEKELENGANKGMTRTEIVGNSMLMILAGYENTGNTMAFMAYNFAHYPEIQTEVQKEVDEMLKTHGEFNYAGVNSLKLLDMSLNETLRLYNPVLRNARVCTREVTINGLTIPKDMAVSIPSFALSHDPEYWDEPFEFKPERMRDMSQIDPMVFQPFGAGPRNCIGMRFALMEIKMSMAKLLHKFTFKPAADTPKPPLELKFGVSVRAVVDYDLRVVPREAVDS